MKRSAHRSHAKRAETPAPASWEQLLIDAVNTPGTVSAAFKAFPSYSFGNQLLAMFQFAGRKMPVEPIATYKRWAALGRQVRKGESAQITLCVPRTFHRKAKDGEDADVQHTGVFFTYGRWWFPMSATDGPDVVWPSLPEWNAETAITKLGLRRLPFAHFDGNCQGYSMRDIVSVNPMADDPTGTLIHELAHGILHQNKDGETFIDGPAQPRTLREVEAESVALILSEVLGLGFQSDHRGYIQHWLRGGAAIPADSARRAFSAAQKILDAGRAAGAEELEPELELAA